MQLRNYPEQDKTFDDKNLFKEREEGLPENIQKVKDTIEYFRILHSRSYNGEVIDFKEINTGYVSILDECITFTENKKKNNEMKKKGFNEECFSAMTKNGGYDSIVWYAQQFVAVFLNPKNNEAIRVGNKDQIAFLRRDFLEQSYRICEYALKYLESYADDDRFSKETKKDLLKVLGEK